MVFFYYYGFFVGDRCSFVYSSSFIFLVMMRFEGLCWILVIISSLSVFSSESFLKLSFLSFSILVFWVRKVFSRFFCCSSSSSFSSFFCRFIRFVL